MASDPIFFLKGTNGQLAVYNSHIVITRKGVLGFMTHGTAGEKSFPYTTIQSVQMKRGGMLANGYLQFGIQGAIERRGGVYNAADDENSIVFAKANNELVERIKEFVQDKIFSNQPGMTPPPVPTQTAPTISAADEILKLKQLLDAGILTKEEFDTKKKQLLGI